MSTKICMNAGNSSEWHWDTAIDLDGNEVPLQFGLVHQFQNAEGKTVIGTCLVPSGYFMYTCRCGETYREAPECPYCGYPATVEVRIMADDEIVLAKAAGIDYTDKANWDTIERLAEAAQDMYSEY